MSTEGWWRSLQLISAGMSDGLTGPRGAFELSPPLGISAARSGSDPSSVGFKLVGSKDPGRKR